MRSHRTDLFSAHVGLQRTQMFTPQIASAMDSLQPLLLLIPITILAGIAIFSLFG